MHMKSLLVVMVGHLSITGLAQDNRYTQLVSVTGAWAPKLTSALTDYFRGWGYRKS